MKVFLSTLFTKNVFSTYNSIMIDVLRSLNYIPIDNKDSLSNYLFWADEGLSFTLIALINSRKETRVRRIQ